MTKKIHLGCGKTILEGWINIDITPLEGVDVVADLNQCGTKPLPFESDSIDEFLASHLLEHIQKPLDLMEELH
ncbi:class I SAM-dependent methyltransferase [Bacillus cereus]